MKYPEYNMEEIEKMIDNYKDHLEDGGFHPSYFNNIPKTSPEYNAAHWLEEYKKDTFKIPYKEFIKQMSMIRDCDMISDYTRRVVNKLIGDKKLFKKMVFCSDGSYRNNRIWGTFSTDYETKTNRYELSPSIRYRLRDELGDKNPDNIGADPVKLINWIYNHFDTIFVQIMFYKSIANLQYSIVTYYSGF